MSASGERGDGAGVYEEADMLRLFKVSAPTLRKAVRDGTIPAPLRLGARMVWPKGVVDGFLSGGSIQTAARVGNGGPVRTAAVTY